MGGTMTEAETPTQKKAVLLLSGGVDSTTLLYHLIHQGYKVRGMRVLYGQRHKRELEAAELVLRSASIFAHDKGQPAVSMTSVAVDPALFADAKSSQVVNANDVPVPEGHYADESMKATVVPNRNMLLISMAGVVASAWGANVVGYAAHAGDHPIYADCRPEFAELCGQALKIATGVELYRPFINMTKTDVVKLGTELGVPYELTYSCYKGGEKHCGKCGTCVERAEAFRDAGVPDPTVYEV